MRSAFRTQLDSTILFSTLLLANCNSNNSPTAPSLEPPIPPVRYSGTAQILGVEGSATDDRLTCALARAQVYVGQAVDFDISLGDLPLSIPPGGRWSSSFFGIRNLDCRMQYVQSATGIEVTALSANCRGQRQIPPFDTLAGGCETEHGADRPNTIGVSPESFSLPPLTANGEAILGVGDVDAELLRVFDNGLQSAETDVIFRMRFDLRRVN